MPHSDRHLRCVAAIVAIASLGAHAVGCSSTTNEQPSGTQDAGPGENDGGGGGGADANRSPPDFLEPSTYADLVTIDPSFPFAVTAKHAADDSILGSRWGRHGGPIVTTGTYGSSGAASPKVVAWTVSGGPTAAATRKDTPIVPASALPASLFYGADGMVDLPFGSLSLLSYSGSGAAFAGEALLYTAAYDRVQSRAKVNGFYSGIGVESASGPLLVYSGLSPLSVAASSTNDNGLYAAPVCEGTLLAPAPCAAPWKLFAWRGASGPVAVDAIGDVFVGASLTGASTSDAVLGLARGQLGSGTLAAPATIAEIDSGGTSSIAAVSPEGDAPGWVLGLGYDGASPIYAASYTSDGAAVAPGTTKKNAITKGSGVTGISVFTDSDGDLWLAVTKGTTGSYLELRRKPSQQ